MQNDKDFLGAHHLCQFSHFAVCHLRLCILMKRRSRMAFGEEKHKKTTFEKITMLVIVLMVIATIAGLVFPAISTLL